MAYQLPGRISKVGYSTGPNPMTIIALLIAAIVAIGGVVLLWQGTDAARTSAVEPAAVVETSPLMTQAPSTTPDLQDEAHRDEVLYLQISRAVQSLAVVTQETRRSQELVRRVAPALERFNLAISTRRLEGADSALGNALRAAAASLEELELARGTLNKEVR